MEKDNSPAFTLIETLIAILITAIVFSFGFASFREFSRRQYLEGYVRSVKGDLRLAQEQALSGKKDCTNTSDTLSGVDFDRVSITSYKITEICIPSLSNFDIKTVTLPADMSLSLTTDPIRFKVLGQGVETVSEITITMTYANLTREIKVTKTGEIR